MSMERFTSLKLLIRRGLQHHQKPALRQTSENNSTQSLASKVEGKLFIPQLQSAPKHPLLGPPKVPGGAHLTGLTQKIYLHSRSSLRITKHPTFLGTTLDRPIKGNQLTIQVSDCRAYFLSFFILCTPHLNKIFFYAPL